MPAPTPRSRAGRRRAPPPAWRDRRGDGQVLRVPLERLNELVRVVSELVINRSTFEQHHLALIEQVDELKLSTARLRRVTHKLESDYEVRALGGNMAMVGPGRPRRRGLVGGHGFDELEFDRYTEFHLLTRELTEITSDIATIGNRVAGTIGDFDSDLTRLGRLTREVQDKTMEFRMVPLGTLTTQLERAVRVDRRELRQARRLRHRRRARRARQVAARADGRSAAPPAAQRRRSRHRVRRSGASPPASPSAGRITVRAFHEGTDVLIEVEDDGAGLDLERIRRTAIARGYVTEAAAAAMSAGRALRVHLRARLQHRRARHRSLRPRRRHGRRQGEGRPAERPRLRARRGRARGTTISVRVPMTLAITRILLVRSGGEIFGLPLGAVVQIVRPHPTSIGLVGSERVFTLDGQTYPLRDLAETLGLPRAADAPAVQPVLIANLSRRRIALAVDEIVNSRDAVVKTLGTHLRRVPGIWGATLLGDGTVVLILNPADLAGAAEGPVVVAHAGAARRPPSTSPTRC